MSLRAEARNALLYLRPLALFGAAVLVVLTVSRIVLVLWQLERVRAVEMVGNVFVLGLRFDFVLLGALLALPVLLMPFVATSRFMLRWGGLLVRGYLVACFALVLFVELATPSFINQYDSRPNRLFVEYLIYPKEVVSTLVGGYGFQVLGAAIA